VSAVGSAAAFKPLALSDPRDARLEHHGLDLS
jgi:hypothetical protein